MQVFTMADCHRDCSRTLHLCSRARGALGQVLRNRVPVSQGRCSFHFDNWMSTVHSFPSLRFPWPFQSARCEVSSCQLWPCVLVSRACSVPWFCPIAYPNHHPTMRRAALVTSKHRPNGQPSWLLCKGTPGWGGGPSKSEMLHFWES